MEVKVADDDKALKKKSLTGRWPVLETKEGTLISESLPIARYMSRQHSSFNGSDEGSSKYCLYEDHVEYHRSLNRNVDRFHQLKRQTCSQARSSSYNKELSW